MTASTTSLILTTCYSHRGTQRREIERAIAASSSRMNRGLRIFLYLFLFPNSSFSYLIFQQPSRRNLSLIRTVCSATKKSKGTRESASPEQAGDEEMTKPKKVIKGSKSTTVKKAKPKKKATTKKKKQTGPTHWIEDTDECLVEYRNANSAQGVSSLHFKVRGNPRPLVRHRTSFGRVYNPSEKLQESFRQAVHELIFSKNDIRPPIFDADESLVMTVVFRLKRPKKHFKSGKPGPNRFRADAPPQTGQTRTDVDNLIKFVMDSMNEVLYPDDRQIMSVHVTKVLDNEGFCEGSTEIYIRSIEDQDVDDLVENSLETIKGGSW